MRFDPKTRTGWFHASLFPQLIAPIVAMAVAVLLANELTSSLFFQDTLIKSFRATEENYLDMQAGNIETLLRRYSNLLYGAAVDGELLAMTRGLESVQAKERSELELSVREYLANSIFNTDVTAATLALHDGRFIAYTRLQDTQNWPSWFSSNIRSGYDDALQALCSRAQKAGRAVVGTEPRRYSGSNVNLIHLACPVSDLLAHVSYGTLILSVNTARLCETVNPETSGDRYAQGILTTPDGTIIAHTDAAQFYHVLGAAEGDLAGDISRGALPSDPLLLNRDLGRMGFRLYRIVDQSQLKRRARGYSMQMALLVALILSAMMTLVALVLRRVLRSMRALQQGIDAASRGDLEVRVPVTDRMEIGRITSAFNHMAEQLSQARQREAEQSRRALDAVNRLRVAEIRVLENQINSHFLYNTLNIINYTAMESGSINTSRQIKHLANMLRYTFQHSDAVVDAASEAEWLEAYLALQKLRFGKSFDYSITVDPRVANWPMRKLIAQPFVENSVIHGLAGRERGGLVSVAFLPFGKDRMRIAVRDNGCGIPLAQLREMQARFDDPGLPSVSGIGMENARQRLLSYYGGAAKVILRSWPGEGAAVVLILPPFRESGGEDQAD